MNKLMQGGVQTPPLRGFPQQNIPPTLQGFPSHQIRPQSTGFPSLGGIPSTPLQGFPGLGPLPPTSVGLQPNIPELKGIVEKAGGIFRGIQEFGEGTESQIMFDNKEGASFFIPISKLNEAAVKAKLAVKFNLPPELRERLGGKKPESKKKVPHFRTDKP